MICPGCGLWVAPIADQEAGVLRCSACQHATPHRFRPLCIVTGPSGAGKTAVLAPLTAQLPDWDIFETDIVWDSAGDWKMAQHNWLRIAASLHAQNRPVLLAGTIMPQNLANCAALAYFADIHYLALIASPATMADRLRARPIWRGADDSFIANQLDYLRHLTETTPDSFALISTENDHPETTASRIAQWARACWLGTAPEILP